MTKTKLFSVAIFVLVVAVLTCLITGCTSMPSFINPGDNLGGGGIAQTPTEATDESGTLIEKAGTKDVAAIKNDVSSADAVIVTDSVAEITENGDYLLEGNYVSVLVAKGVAAHLFLNNAVITNPDGNAISSGKNCDVTLTVSGVNSVTNGGEDVNAIHIKGNLKINGNGVLNVRSDSKSGIKASKDLCIVDVTLNVTCENHGVTAQSVTGDSATINILSAKKDGIQAECDYDEPSDASQCVFTTEIGYITLKNVNYRCSVYGDGLQADTFIYLDGGSYEITTTGVFVEKSDANVSAYGLTNDDFKFIYLNGTYQRIASDYRGNDARYALQQGCKGIKVGEIEYDSDGDGEDDTVVTDNTHYSILIKSGTFNVNSTDDGIHANSGDIIINGGMFTVITYDDGIAADNLLKINAGTINVTDSYEGMEGAYVEINGGTIDVHSSDDGINAASDLSSVKEHIIIADGAITVDAEGDGLDSNGSILISGGTVTVFGPTKSDNAGLDSDSGVMVTGGTLFVTSALGMVETPGSNSLQCVLSLATSSAVDEGNVISVKNADGDAIISVSVKKRCQSVIISTSGLVNGGTYSVYNGESLLQTFTVSSTITYVGASQNQRPSRR
ncbi:MAG: carbohydrate-binding domain-containing protein [Christensenellales bacterium]